MIQTGGARWWALLGLMLAILVVSMDGTILSVASPTLAVQLKASESQLQWFSSGYLLVLAATVLPTGRLGDRMGRKRVLFASVTLFGASSVWCALSTSPTAFLIARLAMGAAGAAITVTALSVLAVLFDERERPKAVGIYQGVNFLALPLGPVLGGWMLTHLWWGWVFLMNAPVALLAAIGVLALVPESKAPGQAGFDLTGAAVSTAGLIGMTYGVIEAGQDGWTSPLALTLMIAGAVVFAGFLFWERRVIAAGKEPLLDLTLFRSPAFTWGAILGGVVGLAMIGVLFVMPQFFQGVQGATAIASGLRLLPLLAGLVAGAIVADRVARLAGWRTAITGGFVIIAAGALLGASTQPDTGFWPIATWMFLLGLGVGLALATSSSAALSQLDTVNSGSGSAIVQLIQKLSAPFGSAILGSAVSAIYLAHLNDDDLPGLTVSAAGQSVFAGVAIAEKTGSHVLLAAVRSAFTAGLGAALLTSAGFAIAGIILAVLFMPGRRETQGIMDAHGDAARKEPSDA
ncbi:MFS transporter [Humibacter albus]|uniref:MFS transporter n=1 Tax=Humibacter albus TaxID=427754 RepID=UPI0003B4A0B0|nr:MFS transporter [Humibacter albus]